MSSRKTYEIDLKEKGKYAVGVYLHEASHILLADGALEEIAKKQMIHDTGFLITTKSGRQFFDTQVPFYVKKKK